MADCTLKAFSPDGGLIAIIDNAESVRLTRRHRGIGSFSLQINADKNYAADLCALGIILMINNDPQKVALVCDWEYSETPEGRFWTVRGFTPQDLARRRIVVPPTETDVPGALGWDRIQDTPENILRHYAFYHLIQPRDAKRAFPNLSLEPPQKLPGDPIRWQARFEPVDRVLEAVCEKSDLGWRIDYDPASHTFIFRVCPGEIHTLGGNMPVLFSPALENTKKTQLRVCYDGRFSTGYAGGQGEDEKRLIQIVGSGSAGWQRVESFIDAGSAATLDELLLYGSQQLEKQENPVAVSFEGVMNAPFLFERDYTLGDLITFSIPNAAVSMNTRITEVTECWEGASLRVDLVLGAKEPNLLTEIQKLNSQSAVR